MRSITLLILMVVIGFVATPRSTSSRPSDLCRPDGAVVPMAEVPEASGVAVSRTNPDRLWVHNDSRGPMLFAIDSHGAVVQRVRVDGAQARDWEDIAAAPCGSGSCLYIADIGDNQAKRREVAIYLVPEPKPGEAAVKASDMVRATYPDGAHNAEAFFIVSDRMFIVTKEHPPTLYRFPKVSGGMAAVRLEKVKILPDLGGKATGAADSEDGRWVALRTHTTVAFFHSGELTSPRPAEPVMVDVASLHEPQGEGIAFGPDGVVYLVGEGGGNHRPGTFARLRCRLGER